MPRLIITAVAASQLVATAAFSLNQFVVVRSTAEGDAMRLAIRDFEQNLYTVTGVAPVFMDAPPHPGQLPQGTAVLYFGTTGNAPWLTNFSLPSPCLETWESHCVVAVAGGGAGTNGYDSIVSTGFGLRGAIFGGYTFTDVVLGFKPLFLFTDTPPAYAGPGGVQVNDTLSIVYPSPAYTYRAVFVNDEDLTGVHRADPLGKNVFDLAAWDVNFQTALRMKADVVLVGTNPFPDDTATALAARRGLVVSHHHYDLLGSNVFSWPLSGSDWDWSTNTGTMALLWRASIAAQADYPEVMWSVGMRGLNDEPYPGCGNAGNDAACGAAISQALGNQTAWLRATPGQENATVILYMWDELLGLLSGGYLIIPPNVHVVFTDAGDGYVRLDGNWTEYSAGVYYHTAMLDGTANQLTEMVPVSRIAEQLLNVVSKSKSTTVFVLNLSDLKPCPMTTAATFALAWDPKPWNVTQDFNATARTWYAQWAVDYVGLDPASPAPGQYAALWETYFNIPYIFNGNSDNLLAGAVANSANEIAKDWAAGKGVQPSTIAAVGRTLASVGGSTVLAQLSALNASAWTLLSVTPPSNRAFLASHMLTQFGLQTACITSLVQLAAAASALAPSAPGGPVPDPTAGSEAVATAVSSMESLMALRRMTEGDASAWAGLGPDAALVNIPAAWPLRGYYLGDTLSDMQWSLGSLKTLALSLSMPLGSPLMPVRPTVWYQFEAYQAENTAAYPLINFNPQWNLPTYARVNCRVSDVSAGDCGNGPDGGWFTKGSGAEVTMQIMMSLTGQEPHPASRAAMKELRKRGLGVPPVAGARGDEYSAAAVVLRYTTDGTTPGPSSPAYVPGAAPRLTDLLPTGASTLNLKVMGWIDGMGTGQVTDTTFTSR